MPTPKQRYPNPSPPVSTHPQTRLTHIYKTHLGYIHPCEPTFPSTFAKSSTIYTRELLSDPPSTDPNAPPGRSRRSAEPLGGSLHSYCHAPHGAGKRTHPKPRLPSATAAIRQALHTTTACLVFGFMPCVWWCVWWVAWVCGCLCVCGLYGGVGAPPAATE